jgi:hypothetical protein
VNGARPRRHRFAGLRYSTAVDSSVVALLALAHAVAASTGSPRDWQISAARRPTVFTVSTIKLAVPSLYAQL